MSHTPTAGEKCRVVLLGIDPSRDRAGEAADMLRKLCSEHDLEATDVQLAYVGPFNEALAHPDLEQPLAGLAPTGMPNVMVWLYEATAA